MTQNRPPDDASATLELPPELVEQFARGNGVIFIGAGLSAGAGLPTWGELLTPLVARLPGNVADATSIDKAQYYQNAFGRGNLIDAIEENITRSQPPPTAVHRLLTALPVRYIFTTNYDRLIERAFEEAGRPLRRVIEDIRLSSINNSVTTLIKVHGDFDAPRSIIISTEDYDNYLAGKPAISDFIKVHLQTQSVLFLGYSFNDENLRRLLRQVTREMGAERRNLFSIQFDASGLVDEELRRRGVRTISLPATSDRTGSLTRWLDNFIRAIRAHQPDATAGPLNIRHNVPEMSDQLYGREPIAADLSRLLQSVLGAVRLVGPPGIGKSHVASYVGRRATRPAGELFGAAPFDYVVWYSGRRERHWVPSEAKIDEVDDVGELGLNGIIDTIAITIGYPKIRQMASTLLKLGAVDLLLSQYRVLVIIDQIDEVPTGIHPADTNRHPLIDWIVRIPAPSKALIVSQYNEVGTPAVEVPRLTDAEAVPFARKLSTLLGIRELSPTEASDMLTQSGGNPQQFQLSIARSFRPERINVVTPLRKTSNARVQKVAGDVVPDTWSELSEAARTVLRTLSVASDDEEVSRLALEAATMLNEENFRAALKEAASKGLIEIHLEAPPRGERVRASLLALKLCGEHRLSFDEADGIQDRLCGYYEHLIRSVACRSSISEPYWSSLVNPEMILIDAEWHLIEELFARRNLRVERRLEIAPLLIHYLDSRQLHGLRRQFAIEAAEQYASRGDRLLSARFYVDALVWSEMERGDVDSVLGFIDQGLQIFTRSSESVPAEIWALAQSWTALVEMLGGRFDAAQARLALIATDGLKPWIMFRVGLVSGELALRRGDYPSAIKKFMECERLANSYGGEGGGYQTSPRIGLALLAQDSLGLAEQQFRRLINPSATVNGNLAGRYGLALVRAARGVAGAGEEVDAVRRSLLKTSGAHSFVNLAMAVLSQRLVTF